MARELSELEAKALEEADSFVTVRALYNKAEWQSKLRRRALVKMVDLIESLWQAELAYWDVPQQSELRDRVCAKMEELAVMEEFWPTYRIYWEAPRDGDLQKLALERLGELMETYREAEMVHDLAPEGSALWKKSHDMMEELMVTFEQAYGTYNGNIRYRKTPEDIDLRAKALAKMRELKPGLTGLLVGE